MEHQVSYHWALSLLVAANHLLKLSVIAPKYKNRVLKEATQWLIPTNSNSKEFRFAVLSLIAYIILSVIVEVLQSSIETEPLS